MMTPKIGRAMAAAVVRVNESPERLKERLDEANNTIDNLRAQIRELKRELSAYRLNSDEYTGGRSLAPSETITGEAINGRPVFSIEAAAKAAGMKYHTAYRRVTSGKWEAVQRAGIWRVFADQALTK